VQAPARADLRAFPAHDRVHCAAMTTGTRQFAHGPYPMAAASVTLEQARAASRRADSVRRADTVMDLFYRLTRRDAFALLGSEWADCGALWRWRAELRAELLAASRAELDAMMEPAEVAALALLPDMITVYRGCYRRNRPGLSWSVDRSVAERFPHSVRYHRPGHTPLLRTGVVARSRAVLKLDGGEAGIISGAVRVTGENGC
jgi:hypothetical protein